MANSVDPDQTVPIGEVCSGSTLFASILFVSNVRQLFAADDFSRRYFHYAFFLGALRVNINRCTICLNLKIFFNHYFANSLFVQIMSSAFYVKETRSVTMNIFRKKIFSF